MSDWFRSCQRSTKKLLAQHRVWKKASNSREQKYLNMKRLSKKRRENLNHLIWGTYCTVREWKHYKPDLGCVGKNSTWFVPLAASEKLCEMKCPVVTILDSESSGLGLSTGLGYFVGFMGRALHSHSTLHSVHGFWWTVRGTRPVVC